MRCAYQRSYVRLILPLASFEDDHLIVTLTEMLQALWLQLRCFKANLASPL